MRNHDSSLGSWLWLGLFLVAVLPFLSIWRVGPLPSFFLEIGSLLGALAFFLMTVGAGCLRGVAVPRASWYFVGMAIFWAIQARWLNLTYAGMSDMVSWTFMVLALMCWACRGWTEHLGTEQAVSLLASVIVAGCVVQAAIGWLQYTGLASHFSGYLMYRKGIVEGQLAQRNHFAHYLMWGVLCSAWLWSQRRLSAGIASALVLFFAATISLTGSRTVFAYILMLTAWLPIYRIIGGRESTRPVIGLALAAFVVLVSQYAVEPMLNWISSTNQVQTAAERMVGSQIEGSGRGYEWRKAWQIFLSAPLFGYGWGSYSLYGFLENVYPTGFRPYENNVLFTHSHNSFLNLLAEMGLVGTTLILGGLAWAVKGSLQRINQPVGGLLIALMGISLVHSALEYPLWYIYFLSAFTLFIGFSPAPQTKSNRPKGQSSLHFLLPYVAALFAVFIAIGILRLASAYQELRQFSGNPETLPTKRTQQIVGLLRIAKTEPMLRHYAQFQLSSFINPNDATQPEWAEEALREALQYRPYANAYKYALVAYQAGKIEDARDWMRLMYHYYPAKMPAYAAPIMNTNHYLELRDDYTRTCQAYRQAVPSAPLCAEALPLPMRVK